MIVRHEINEQEMIDIFDQFAGSIIDGYPCEEITEYLHEAVRELAVDQTIDISKGDFTPFLKDFISCFSFDDKNGRYLFRFEGLEFYGNTKVIKTEGGAMSHCRSKAYRDLWDMVYRVARTELSHGKSGHEFNVLYLVKYMLKATHISVNENAVDLGDAIKMVEQAIDSTQPQPDAKPPTQSELRRFELEQNAERLAEYEQTLFKSRHTATPRQIWTLYYRAKRLDRQTGGKATSLFYCFHHVGNNDYTKDMRKCCVDIFYPEWKRSKSAERRIEWMLKANGPFTLNFCTVADLAPTPFDEDLPF